MKAENEGLESKVKTESRIGHHAIYASLTGFFAAGSVMAGIGAHHVEEGKTLLTVLCGYSGMLAGFTAVWWRNDFWAYRRKINNYQKTS